MVLQVIFLLMFLVFGTALVHAGLQAIRDRAYTLDYAEHTRWAGPDGPGGSATENSAEYRGRAAVLFGAGFLAAGTMLFAWAGGLGLGLAARAAGRTVPRYLVRTVGAVSLAALLAACLALFPPWRLPTLPPSCSNPCRHQPRHRMSFHTYFDPPPATLPSRIISIRVE